MTTANTCKEYMIHCGQWFADRGLLLWYFTLYIYYIIIINFISHLTVRQEMLTN